MDQVLLLTPEEAARALSISRSKLYELLADGRLASVRIGALRRIPVDALTAFIADLDGTDLRDVSSPPGGQSDDREGTSRSR